MLNPVKIKTDPMDIEKKAEVEPLDFVINPGRRRIDPKITSHGNDYILSSWYKADIKYQKLLKEATSREQLADQLMSLLYREQEPDMQGAEEEFNSTRLQLVELRNNASNMDKLALLWHLQERLHFPEDVTQFPYTYTEYSENFYRKQLKLIDTIVKFLNLSHVIGFKYSDVNGQPMHSAFISMLEEDTSLQNNNTNFSYNPQLQPQQFATYNINSLYNYGRYGPFINTNNQLRGPLPPIVNINVYYLYLQNDNYNNQRFAQIIQQQYPYNSDYLRHVCVSQPSQLQPLFPLSNGDLNYVLMSMEQQNNRGAEPRY